MSEAEKIREALRIFKLDTLPRSRFGELFRLLKKRYHLLAQKVHPDHSPYQSDLFIRLSGHFEFLRQLLQTSPEQVKNQLVDHPLSLPRDNSGSDFFKYKELIGRFHQATDSYFSNTQRATSLNQLHKSYQHLVEELSSLRSELSALLLHNEQALWREDALHYLKRIDIWLRESQSSVS